MTLKRTKLKYFQSWKDQEIDFDPGFNAIIGNSDAGKSALERAFRWVFFNRPSGDDFVSWLLPKGKSTFVKLLFDDFSLTRKKGKEVNCYKVNDKVFDVVKTDVPEDVRDILNVKDFNILPQHEKYFLIQNSPGDRAKILNKAVGLDVIDKVFDYLNSESLRVNRELKTVTSEKENVVKKLREYEDLDEISSLLNDLKVRADSLAENSSKLMQGEKAYESHQENRREIKRLQGWLKIESEYSLISQQKDIYESLVGIKTSGEENLRSLLSLKEKASILKKNLCENIKKYVNILSQNKVCPTCENTITEKNILKIREKLNA